MIEILEIDQAYSSLLSEIHHLAFADLGDSLWDEKAMTTALKPPGSRGFLATYDKLPAGFILMQQVLDEAEILSIAVVPSYRKKNVAKTLISNIYQILRVDQVKKVFLEVREDNKGALQLYNKLGFKKVGLRKGYYKASDGKCFDALVLRLSLD